MTYLIRPLSYWRIYAAYQLVFDGNRPPYLVPFDSIFLGITYASLDFKAIQWWYGGIFLIMIALSFWVYYFLKLIVGFMAFWFTEIWWLIGTLEVMNLLFSGFMIPVDLMPSTFQKISAWLPFQYLVYFPTKVLLGEFEPNQILKAITIQLFWLVIITCLARWVWRRGVKSYTAYGN